MIDLLIQATRPTWGDEVIKIVASLWGMIGGTAGLIAFILALKQAGLIGQVQEKSERQGRVIVQQHDKINELAEKNPAEVAPLPEPPNGLSK